jgi:hypothetical protein
MKVVEWYENQVTEKQVTGKGRTTPTPYEDECYTYSASTKPYSVEAMRAQRHPGEQSVSKSSPPSTVSTSAKPTKQLRNSHR